MVLCLTATLTELNEKETIGDLGLDETELFRISKNPVNNKISLINLSGKLDIAPLISLLAGPKDRCPRIIIFENSLVECGQRYLEFKQVNSHKITDIDKHLKRLN